MKEKLKLDTKSLILRHGEETLELFAKLEGVTKINFRYVSQGDLPIPLEKIINMRKEHEEENKLWKRLKDEK